MIKLRTAINSYLKSLHPRVYYNTAPENAVFPYMIYSMTVYPNGENGSVVNFDIDGYDQNDSNDFSTLESIMELLNPLDKHAILTNDLAITFFLDSQTTIDETEKRIKRIKYIYSAKLNRR